MGVLDDAIREHLELRRRHGVAEEELLRQEEEALGPARREVAPDETDEEGAAAAEADQAEAPAAPVEAAVGEPTEEHDVELEELPDDDQPELSESLPESAVRSDVADETLEPEAPEPDFEDLDDDLPEEEELEEGDFDEDDDPPDDGDVLEDTPDFLQETPEHDRLWFEQKPPRDFDFD